MCLFHRIKHFYNTRHIMFRRVCVYFHVRRWEGCWWCHSSARWPPSKRLLVAGVSIFVGVEPMDIFHDTLGNIPCQWKQNKIFVTRWQNNAGQSVTMITEVMQSLEPKPRCFILNINKYFSWQNQIKPWVNVFYVTLQRPRGHVVKGTMINVTYSVV